MAKPVPRRPAPASARPRQKPSRVRRVFGWLAVAVLTLTLLFYAAVALGLVLLKWVDPPTTGVQIERRIESWTSHKPYKKRYAPLPMSRISPALQHAVVAAEDARFRKHNGIDWVEMQKVIDQDFESGKLGRGGSTITQQLVKNLFFSNGRSLIRKGLEFTIAPLAERILGKDRILELYINVIEWGPGVFGAEAAAQFWFKQTAVQVDREHAARLASIIPNPLKRRPDRMAYYTAEILTRMRQMGW